MHKPHAAVLIGLFCLSGDVAAESVDTLFKQQDSDRDGRLTATEAAQGLGKAFPAMDLDGNGTLDRDEVAADIVRNSQAAIPGSVLATLANQTLQTWDDNRDGKVSRKEYQVSGVRFLLMADADRDGRVSKDELKRFRREP